MQENKISKKKNLLKKSLQDNGIIIDSLEQICGGLNSQTFCITIKGIKRVLKFYPNNDILNRDRLGNELKFLQFLQKHNIKNIPSPILWDRKKNWMILSWLEGQPIKNIESKHVKLLVEFILKIESLKYKKDAKKLNNASEAFFDINSHLNCIKKRFSLLSSYLKELNFDDSIKNKFFINFNEDINKDIIRIYSKFTSSSLTPFFKEKISLDKKILSQSDVGFHNVFLYKSSKLQFFDFEYAGWDDSHKLIADLILQPDKPVPLKFIKEIEPLINKYIYSQKDIKRFILIMEISRIKWLLIISNKILKNQSNQNIIDKTLEKLDSYQIISNTRIKFCKDFLESKHI